MQACMPARVPCHCASYPLLVQFLAISTAPGISTHTLLQLRLKEEELRDYQRAEEEALTKRQLLEQSLKDLEYQLEAKSHLKDDRSRLVKQMEVCGNTGCCYSFLTL